MRYHIDYQHLPKGALRPTDDGEIVGIEATSQDGLVILPNVGDYVRIDNSANGGEHASFDGKVRSRLFTYCRVPGDMFCTVNIVVEETDDDWGKLEKC